MGNDYAEGEPAEGKHALRRFFLMAFDGACSASNRAPFGFEVDDDSQ